MITILRNIEKRKQLAQLVYDGYCDPSDEEKKELANEVGAAYGGYIYALEDIIQLIVDGQNDSETLKTIKDFIIGQVNGAGSKGHFRFSEVPTTEMKDYIRTAVKKELISKRCNSDDAEIYVNHFIECPETRQELIDEWELDSIRICEHCGAPMNEGYLVNDCETYCSEECAKAELLSPEGGWTEETFNEHLAHADEEDSVIYWTQWEG